MMARVQSAQQVAIQDILADGGWHEYRLVRDAVALTVPASRAVAIRRQYRDRQRRYFWKGNSASVAVEDEVRIGSRDIAMRAIIAATKSGRVERDGDMIRLRPTS